VPVQKLSGTFFTVSYIMGEFRHGEGLVAWPNVALQPLEANKWFI